MFYVINIKTFSQMSSNKLIPLRTNAANFSSIGIFLISSYSVSLFSCAIVSSFESIKLRNENYHCLILYIKKSMFRKETVNYPMFKRKKLLVFSFKT